MRPRNRQRPATAAGRIAASNNAVTAAATAAVMAVLATTASAPITAAMVAKTVRARTVTPRTGRTLRQGSQAASEMLHSSSAGMSRAAAPATGHGEAIGVD